LRELNVKTGRAVTIPAETIEALIALGHQPPDAMDGADLALLKDHDWINRTGRDLWEAAAGGLATQEVIALIKGLVVTEHGLNWIGGSVAAAIWVFHELQRRDPALAAEMADWVLARTRNPYLPFGCPNYGATSLEEFRRLDEGYEARCQARGERHLQEKAELSAKATNRREKCAHSKTLHAQGHVAADVRRELIDKLSLLSAVQRLEAVASDPVRPSGFYPETWASLTQEELASLSGDLRQRLLMKLSEQRVGPWRALYLALRSLDRKS
jgi:hypothetical protein